jgi:hypothetical protein
MPRTYRFTGDTTHCEECSTELEPIVYKGLKLACPECVPDKLMAQYRLGSDEAAYLQAYGEGDL